MKKETERKGRERGFFFGLFVTLVRDLAGFIEGGEGGRWMVLVGGGKRNE